MAEAADFLEPGFLLCESGSHPFSRREFLKCIRSALLNDKYKYRYSHKKLVELGLLSPEYEKVDSYTYAITSYVKPDCLEMSTRLDVGLSELVKSVVQAFDGK